MAISITVYLKPEEQASHYALQWQTRFAFGLLSKKTFDVLFRKPIRPSYCAQKYDIIGKLSVYPPK